ncbi:MAG: MBL fold metallo-hydrolase [Planctomycetota bacterium]|jgi:phosphoribosyl 1,2-cyclic phosphodiesterase
MNITVWGARGSIPVSGKDFLAYGGDTTCVEVVAESGETIILDAGTGIRPLGNHLLASSEGPRTLHLFLSHAHWDHIMGFPFFKPIYRKETTVQFHGCSYAQESIQTFFKRAMHPPFFPVDLSDAAADLRFSPTCSEVFEIGSVCVKTIPLNHPNQGFGFRLDEGGKGFAFLPDNELTHPHPGGKTFDDYAEFLSGVDCLIHDAEYLPEEYAAFSRGWGHSVFLDTVRLARVAGAKRLLLWHLNQERTDGQVDAMVGEAKRAGGADLSVQAAATGMAFAL